MRCDLTEKEQEKWEAECIWLGAGGGARKGQMIGSWREIGALTVTADFADTCATRGTSWAFPDMNLVVEAIVGGFEARGLWRRVTLGRNIKL